MTASLGGSEAMGPCLPTHTEPPAIPAPHADLPLSLWTQAPVPSGGGTGRDPTWSFLLWPPEPGLRHPSCHSVLSHSPLLAQSWAWLSESYSAWDCKSWGPSFPVDRSSTRASLAEPSWLGLVLCPHGGVTGQPPGQESPSQGLACVFF